MLNWGGLAEAGETDLALERSVPGARRAGLGTCAAGAGEAGEGAERVMNGCVTGAAARVEGEKRHVRALRKLDAMVDDQERGDVATGEVEVGTGTGSGLDIEIGFT